MGTFVTAHFFGIGPHYGKTETLGENSVRYHFKHGAVRVVDTPEKIPLHAKYLKVNWGTVGEDHPELGDLYGKRDLPEGIEWYPLNEVPGDLQPQGGGSEEGDESGEDEDGEGNALPGAGGSGLLPDGNGFTPRLTDAAQKRLVQAIQTLDPKNDEHWSKDGAPSLSEVTRLFGQGNLTREDVALAIPDYSRKVAAKSAKAAKTETK